MPSKPTPPMTRTGTPGIYERCGSFIVKWLEDGKTKRRKFATYELAVAFRRDYVIPYRQRRALPPTAIAPRQGGGWIYAFQSRYGSEPVKVGYSTNPARRLKEIETNGLDELDLVFLVPATQAMEKRLHTCLADHRIRGEWYGREVLHLLTLTFTRAFAIDEAEEALA